MGDSTYERRCAALEAEVDRFVATVAGVDPATPVPTCPGWTVADLVRHHGTTYRWMEYLVRRRCTERIRSRDVPLDLPADPAGYPQWLVAGAAACLRTFRAADPDAPVWTFGADRHVRFWPRRLLAEAVVHRADAELAVGRAPLVPADLAVDSVDELLEILPFFDRVADRLRSLGRAGEVVHLHATDAAGEWLITLADAGFGWARGHGKGAVAVRGTASDLLLLAYGRLPSDGDRCTVHGDRELLTGWLAATAL